MLEPSPQFQTSRGIAVALAAAVWALQEAPSQAYVQDAFPLKVTFSPVAATERSAAMIATGFGWSVANDGDRVCGWVTRTNTAFESLVTVWFASETATIAT